jgi:nickel superoxide dismutase
MRTSVAGLIAAIWLVVTPDAARAHCEIPCGIYGDELRFEMLSEHVTTIEKSMQEIAALAAKSKRSAQDENQLARWVANKEEHASAFQTIVSQYFLHQRIKPAPVGAKEYPRYIEQVTAAHRLLIGAMKAKQSVDLTVIPGLRTDLEALRRAYLGPGAKPPAK